MTLSFRVRRQLRSIRRPSARFAPASAFLADIAHEAVPVGKIADGDITIGLANPGNGDTEYDNELLDAHFIAGDGRVNENIGLTAVHHVFHSEHNRLVDQTKSVVLGTGDLAFLNEWLVTDVAALPATPAADCGSRLGRRAPVPGREVHHRNAVPASRVRGVRAQGPAADQLLRRVPTASTPRSIRRSSPSSRTWSTASATRCSRSRSTGSIRPSPRTTSA